MKKKIFTGLPRRAETLLAMTYKAFTLAEVLITLGIIGVVAALTLPNMIANYKKCETAIRVKKFYSTMEQAISRSEIDNGEMQYWENPTQQNNKQQLLDWLSVYLLPYISKAKLCGVNENKGVCAKIASGYVTMILSDGSTVTMTIGGAGESGAYIHLFFDTNGLQKPNTDGKDIFNFRFWIISNNNYYKNYFGCEPFSNNKIILLDRESLLTACQANAAECSCLIMYDGWEFKDDYPYNL